MRFSPQVIDPNRPEFRAALRKSVWQKGPGKCWPWMGRKRDKYGRIAISTYRYTENFTAHRVAYVLAYGPFNFDLDVLHKCDNPPCCNPQHLFLGTHQDNMDDCTAKGRQPCGERNGSAELTEEQILKIRFKAALGITQADIAKEFGVCNQHISKIVNYLKWKCVK